MRFSVFKKDKCITLDSRKTGFFGKCIGLMFRTKNTKNLLFDFNKDTSVGIHSWFVFFPFLIVWLDSKNRVLEQEIVRPFRNYVKPKIEFRKFVEIPINSENNKIIGFFVGKSEKFK